MAKQYRQGDLLFIETNREPVGTKAGHLVLAEGEATGHKHQILDLSGSDLFIDARGNMILRVKGEAATVVHEEHGPITLTRGNWEVRRQREYSPGQNSFVAD